MLEDEKLKVSANSITANLSIFVSAFGLGDRIGTKAAWSTDRWRKGEALHVGGLLPKQPVLAVQ